MRLAIASATALLLAAAPAATAKKITLKLPKAGNASALQVTLTGKKPSPKIRGKIPVGVGVAVVARKGKKPKTFVLTVAAFRRGRASTRQDIGLTAKTATVTIGNRGVTGAAVLLNNFLGTTTPKKTCEQLPSGDATFVTEAYRSGMDKEIAHLVVDSLFSATCANQGAPAIQSFLCKYNLRECLGSPPGPPAWTLTAGPTFTPGAGASDIVTGEVNGDGFPDLVVGGTAGIDLFPGAANNTIGAPTHVDTSHPWDFVDTGDFNGDGKGDLLGVSSSAGIVQSFLGDGSGAFSPGPAFTFGSGAPIRGLAVGQLNADSRSDVVVGQNDGQAAVLIGQSSGGFLGNDFPTGNGGALFSLAVADFNADGSPDLVVVGGGSTPQLFVLINHNDGTFPPATGTNLLGTPNDVAVGDLTGDGKPDVAVSEGGGNVIQLFPGSGDGTFGGGISLQTGPNPVGVLIGDVNADNVPDVLGLNQGNGMVSTFLGQAQAGLGGYTSPIGENVGANPAAMALFNFNGDAKRDLAVVNGSPSGGIFLSGP